MPFFKSLSDRLADQAEAKKRLLENARKVADRPSSSNTKSPSPASPKPTTPAVVVTSRPQRPWAEVRAGSAPLKYSARTTSEQIWAQPWTNGLVSTLLNAAERGGVTLCLIWPAQMSSLALLHALANVERVFARDLKGLRTLLYPGTHASRSSLHGVLMDRPQLSDFYRSLWAQQSNGSTDVVAHTSSPALLAALAALNDVRIRHPELPSPSIAELIPAFVFTPESKEWAATVESPLERTLSKVERLVHRRDLRQKVGTEWRSPDKAPGALMVLHHTAKKDV
jgi:hypothetical protein